MKIKHLFVWIVLMIPISASAEEAQVVDLSQDIDDQNFPASPLQAQAPAPQPAQQNIRSEPAPMVPDAVTYPTVESAPSARQAYQASAINESRRSLTHDERIARLEQQIDNLVQMNLPARLDDLQQQVQKLNGMEEQRDHDLKALNDKLRDFYKDLEQRINQNKSGSPANGSNSPLDSASAKEKSGSTLDSASTTLPSSPTATALPDQQSIPKEQQAYEDAFNALQQKKYSIATMKLNNYLKTYPKGTYAINAHYWLGECYYLLNKHADAAREFKIIANRYASSTKAPDAMLKLGIIYNAMGKRELAKIEFLKLAKRFPESNAARLANQQLEQINY